MATRLTSQPSSGPISGDYNGLSIHAGKAFPSWTDNRGGGAGIWTVPVTEP